MALALVSLVVGASCKDPVTSPGVRELQDATVVTLPHPEASTSAVAETGGEPSDASTTVDASAATDAATAPPPPLVVRDEPTKLANGQTIAGPCVTPAMDASSKSGKGEERLPPDFFTPSSHEIDVDGDGIPDFVLDGGASRTIMNLRLYLKRGACGYDLGTIEAEGAPERLVTKSLGLFDLRVIQDLCSSRTRTNYCEVVYKFDGRRYRPVSYAPTKRGGLF
jgi:hypothetical protein